MQNVYSYVENKVNIIYFSCSLLFVGEASIQFPESPVCTSVQSKEGLDPSQHLLLSPEAEEEFEHHLSHRRMTTGFMYAKLVDFGETSDESEEDSQSDVVKAKREKGTV